MIIVRAPANHVDKYKLQKVNFTLPYSCLIKMAFAITWCKFDWIDMHCLIFLVFVVLFIYMEIGIFLLINMYLLILALWNAALKSNICMKILPASPKSILISICNERQNFPGMWFYISYLEYDSKFCCKLVIWFDDLLFHPSTHTNG